MATLLGNEIGHLPDAVFTYVARRTREGRVRGQRYPITPETFYNEFKAAAVAAGLPDLCPHDLRHVAGARTLRASGGNHRAAQRHLGHSRISTTTKYAHYMLDELRDAMAAAHSPEENPETAGEKGSNQLDRNTNRLLPPGLEPPWVQAHRGFQSHPFRPPTDCAPFYDILHDS